MSNTETLGFDLMAMRGDAAITMLGTVKGELEKVIAHHTRLVATLDKILADFNKLDAETGIKTSAGSVVANVVASLRTARPDLKDKTDDQVLAEFGIKVEGS